MLPSAHPYRDEIFTQVSLSEALDILCNFKTDEAKALEEAKRGNRHKASSFLKVVLRTTPDMKKTGNIFYGMIQKVSVANYAVNWDYGGVLAKRQEGVAVTEAQKAVYARKWGVKVEGADDSVAPLLMVSIGINDTKNNPNLYLQLFVDTAKKPTAVWYEWTGGTKMGLPLSDDELGKLKKFLPDSEKQLATMKYRSGVDNPIVPHTPHVQSLFEFKINGVYYVITDQSLPVIPDDVRDLALKTVEKARKDRDFCKALLDAAKKEEEALVAGGMTEEAACLQVTKARIGKLVEAQLLQGVHAEREVRKYMEKREFWEREHWNNLGKDEVATKPDTGDDRHVAREKQIQPEKPEKAE